MTTLSVGSGLDGKSPTIVRKGEGVGYSPYVMHRRKDYSGEDAASFRPLRWEEGNEGGPDLRKAGYGYLPFNGGPRIYTSRKSIQARVFSVHSLIVAEEFGLLEASYTVTQLLQSFQRI